MPFDATATAAPLFRPASTESEHDALGMVATYTGWAYDALGETAALIATAIENAPPGPGRERLIRARDIILAATDDSGLGTLHDEASDAAAAYTPDDGDDGRPGSAILSYSSAI
jgi:hypothetical protein